MDDDVTDMEDGAIVSTMGIHPVQLVDWIDEEDNRVALLIVVDAVDDDDDADEEEDG